ncbi:unnamed protein product [Adineta steineri]|uniref:Uncharacterized protein n=1 Tax=Adineta steineri TaxID=433720 RepID=A0A815U310_9BILA|nr:unnamed protein product [Adineta steineri]CAF1508585.1 unnamed protein product [Adineta steineri]
MNHQLPCNGSRCDKCGMCRDWHFNGDRNMWNWFCNCRNGNANANDLTRWRGHEHNYRDGHDHIHRNNRDDRECHECRDGRQCHECSTGRMCRECHDCRHGRICRECRDCPDCGAYKLFTKAAGATCIGFRRHSGLGIGVPGTYLNNYGDEDIVLVAAGNDVIGRASYFGGGHLCVCDMH